MLKIFALLSLAFLALTVNSQAEAEPSTKLSKGEERRMVVVDNDLHAPLFRAVQQVLAGGRRRQGQGRRRNRSPAKHYYKPLYRALKKDDQRELKEICLANITKAEIAKKVEKWVKEAEDPKTKEAYGLFNQERELMRKLKLIGDKNFLEDKSDEAKKLYGELKKLKDDQTLTWDQTCTRRNELLYKSDRDTVEELRRKGKPCFRNESWDKLTGIGGQKKDKKEDE